MFDHCQLKGENIRPLGLIILKISSDSSYVSDENRTSFKGWDEVENYEVFRKDENGVFLKIWEVPANTTSYSDSSLCHQLYEYYVRANDRNSSYTSESYIVGNVPRYDYNPRISSITYASVADENEIEVVWPKSSFSEFDYNKVFKY